MIGNVKDKQRMLDALSETRGIVTGAAKMIFIDRQTHYNWLKEDADYKEKVDAIQDIVLDFVENKFYDKIDSNDVTAQIFFLKCKGKKRGYREKDVEEQTQNLVIDVAERLKTLIESK